MRSKTQEMRELLRTVLATRPVEIDCEEFLARVGAFLESRERDRDMVPELRAVSQHLEVCGECKEELAALLKAHGVNLKQRERKEG